MDLSSVRQRVHAPSGATTLPAYRATYRQHLVTVALGTWLTAAARAQVLRRRADRAEMKNAAPTPAISRALTLTQIGAPGVADDPASTTRYAAANASRCCGNAKRMPVSTNMSPMASCSVTQ
jgi:hypothetical protein